MKKSITVICPICGKEVVWKRENRYRPFCSERCKLIDLGQWANEGYGIPDTEPLSDHRSGDDPSSQA